MPSKTAFLFPGQGSVFPRMGEDLCKLWPAARSVYEAISVVSGVNVAAISFSRDIRPLKKVEVAHLALFAHSSAVFAVLDQAAGPDFAAGHSLGELSAIVAAGAVSFEEGIRLVKRRGELFRDCCQLNSGGMVAVRGVPLPAIERAVQKAAKFHAIRVANFNGPGEFVLSGEQEGLREAIRDLRMLGGLVRHLEVEGAFHSPLMETAAKAFAKEIDGVTFKNPAFPIISSSTGEILTTARSVRDELTSHILDPVRWDLVLEVLSELGADLWIEVGPGRVLTSFIHRRDRGAQAYCTTSAAALAKVCERLE